MANIDSRLKRKERIRRKLSGTPERPRLTVYKSLKHIYAQVVDDSSGKTLAFASTLSKELKGKDEGDSESSASTSTSTSSTTTTTSSGKKTQICHRTGSKKRPWVLIVVSNRSLPGHMRHGDVLPVNGQCPSSTTTSTTTTTTVSTSTSTTQSTSTTTAPTTTTTG